MGLLDLIGKRRPYETFFVNSYGNDQTRGIYTFKVFTDNGEVEFKHQFKTPSNPAYSFKYGRFVCINYKNRTGQNVDGGISSYAMTADTLLLASHVSDHGKTYSCACTDGDAETSTKLFATDYYNSEIAVIDIQKKKLVVTRSRYQLTGKGVHPTKQTQSHPTYCTMAPEGDKLIVCDEGVDKIYFFDIDEYTLTCDESLTLDLPAGSGPRKIVFDDQGKYAYILNSISNTVNVYHYQDHHFECVQTIDTFPKDDFEDESEATQILFNEKQDQCYILNSGHDSLSLFQVNQDTGELEFCEFMDTSPQPYDLQIFQDKWIVVVCKKGGIVESYQYVPEKGGMLFETKFFYLVSEPVSITRFQNQT